MNLNKQKTLKSPRSRVENQDQTRTKIRTQSGPNQDQIRTKKLIQNLKNKPKQTQKTEEVSLLLAVKIDKAKLSVCTRLNLS